MLLLLYVDQMKVDRYNSEKNDDDDDDYLVWSLWR